MGTEPGSDTWGIRAARNQALFRAINDELKGAQSAAGDPDMLRIACECADAACVETLEIDGGRYAEVRHKAKHFIVLADHVYPEIEYVVGEDTRYVIVEKTGEAGRFVEAADGSAGGS